MGEKGLLTRIFDREKKQYEYLDIDGYRLLVLVYLSIHTFLEVVYLLCKCTSMVFWNIGSIAIYFTLRLYAKKESASPLIIYWVTVVEIYTHACMAVVFMGFDSGFYYWFLGVFIVDIIPYMTPMYNKVRKTAAYAYSFLQLITLIIFVILDFLEVLPVRFNPPKPAQIALACLNIVTFCMVIMLYLSVAALRTERRKQQLNEAADTDYLTRLYNRQHMQNILYQIMPGQNEVCVAIMDIDHFKNINDTYGHMAGDYVLKEISQMLYKTMDEHLTVGRWGGEEFLFIAESGYRFEDFCDRLETLRKEISEFEFVFSGSSINVTASFGASRYSEGMSKEDLVKLADDRLYAAKESGRNQVVFSDK